MMSSIAATRSNDSGCSPGLDKLFVAVRKLVFAGAIASLALPALAQTPASPSITSITSTPPENSTETPASVPVESAEKTAPYDGRLLRLSEILGSVNYLRVLCKASDPDEWRQAMQELLDKEAAGETARKARLTAAFNRGYRTFASVYTSCTPAAVMADQRYRAEGATLASEIVARFGN
jgi:uncharacterized protein (TIGR02301 family)